MRNIQVIFILLFISLSIPCCFTQSFRVNELEKYWKYRHRFRDDFVRIGLEDPLLCEDPVDYDPDVNDFYSGYSIPAHEIVLRNPPLPDMLNFADQIIDLGWYIGVLATEYKLLKENNQPLDETEQELFYAMKAYERLDKKCERLYYPKTGPCPEEAEINGLFARDDVYYGIPDYNVYSGYIVRTHYYDNDIRPGYYPSGDQIIGLYLGLKLVVACLEETDNYNGIYYYVENARRYANAIATRLEKDDYHMILDDGSGYATSDIGGVYEDYPLAKSAEQITGKSYEGDTYWTFQQFQNKEQEFYTGIQINGNDFVAGKLLANVAIGQSWGVTGTSEGLHNFARYFGLDIYPVLYYFLFGTKNQNYNKIHQMKCYIQALNAPENGPFYIKNGDPAYHRGWAAANRWWRPLKAENGVVGNGTSQDAKFNGLDYMLLHNLYWLQYPHSNNVLFAYTLPVQVNYGIRESNETMLGTEKYPYILYAKKNIVSNSPVNSGSYLEFHAPAIYLTEGFKITSGAYFKATARDTGFRYHITDHFYPGYLLDMGSQKDRQNDLHISRKPVEIYPNPANSELVLHFDYPHGENYRLKIYDLRGREVYCETIHVVDREYKIDVTALKSGIYSVHLISDESVYNERIVIY